MGKENLIEHLKEMIAYVEKQLRFNYEIYNHMNIQYERGRLDALKAMLKYVEGEVNE